MYNRQDTLAWVPRAGNPLSKDEVACILIDTEATIPDDTPYVCRVNRVDILKSAGNYDEPITLVLHEAGGPTHEFYLIDFGQLSFFFSAQDAGAITARFNRLVAENIEAQIETLSRVDRKSVV